MVGGMGLGDNGPIFFSDVWRFDADVEAWRELSATTDAPAGRRYPWAALHNEADTLVYGYGSDSARGESMLGDLWRFTLSTGEWQPIVVDGEAPSARGFSYRLPGPPGTAGSFVGGLDGEQSLLFEAWVLHVPDDLDGEWR